MSPSKGISFGQAKCPKCDHEFAINASPEKTPNASLVLSLDGGGIKGYSSLLILRRIMQEVFAIEEKRMREREVFSQEELDRLKDKPYIYFDFIVGTSTGGLIAIMLSRLEMTVGECIQKYELLGSEIFAHPRRLHIHNKLWLASKFDHKKMAKVMQDTIEEARTPEEIDYQGWSHFAQTSPGNGVHQCKAVVVACKEGEGCQPVAWLFRSYPHPSRQINGWGKVLNPSPRACDLTTWEVARATSAAPSYFKILETAHGKFLDGGLLHNNPVALAWNEAWHMAKLNEPNISAGRAIGCLLSIGTGTSKYQVFASKKQSALGKYFHLMTAPRKIITETSRAHNEMESLAQPHGTSYFRFNVSKGLETMKLDEWCSKRRHGFSDGATATRKMETLDYLTLATEEYLNPSEGADQEPPGESIRTCAQLLVDYRIARQNRRNAAAGTVTPQNGAAH